MKIYLVTAPGHDRGGYGDALIVGSHPEMLVSFMDYAGKERPLQGFTLSGKDGMQEPKVADLGMFGADDADTSCSTARS